MVRKRFCFSKIKHAVLWSYDISDVNGEPITVSFYEKELQKTSQEKLRIEKVLKRKGDKFMSNGKGIIVVLVVGLIKKTLYKMSQYFAKPFRSFGGNINVKVDFFNYATKTGQKV